MKSQNNSAYHGGNKETSYFEVKGIEAIDIDNEEDFELAQAAIEMVSKKNAGIIDKQNKTVWMV